MLTASVHLLVSGVDNPAWAALTLGEREAYGKRVAQDIADALPAMLPDEAETARVIVKIWERFRLPNVANDADWGDFCARAIKKTAQYTECYEPALAAYVDIGPRSR